jgi:hypothetical protein
MVRINATTVMLIGGYNGSYLSETLLYNREVDRWVHGPSLQTGRCGMVCGMVKAGHDSHRYSVVMARDHNTTVRVSLNSVEILDNLNGQWREGPPSRFELRYGASVEDPDGGLILVGGYRSEDRIEIYRLPHTGPDAEWRLMKQALESPRST